MLTAYHVVHIVFAKQMHQNSQWTRIIFAGWKICTAHRRPFGSRFYGFLVVDILRKRRNFLFPFNEERKRRMRSHPLKLAISFLGLNNRTAQTCHWLPPSVQIVNIVREGHGQWLSTTFRRIPSVIVKKNLKGFKSEGVRHAGRSDA